MGSAINLSEIKRFEVTEVYTHPDAKIDIVLVHGLNGHPLNTWSAKNGVFWPSQLLPVALKSEQARVLVYGWNSTVASFGSGSGPSTDMIHQHAQSLLTSLSLERKSEEREQAPIIWVGHSLGGILIKRALELSHDLAGKNSDGLRSIYVSSYGIMFLGTPHNGADPAKWGLILHSIVSATIPKKFMESQSQLIKTLQSNNETLQNINLKFLDIYPNHLQVCMVHESHATDLKFSKAMVVDQLSAGPLLPDVSYFGIEQTHSGMCKFESKNAPGFTNVSMTIKAWASEAPLAVTRYWNDEMTSRRQKDESEMDKLKSKYEQTPALSPQLSAGIPITPDPASSVDNSTIIARPVLDIEPTLATQPSSLTLSTGEDDASPFIKPSGFRPNSIFVGREAELSEMHRMLFDQKKRAEGTSAVLLQSIPGGGKTHLARQYVYEHKSDFPGGIFWIRAKSQSELASGFWDVARKAALTDVEETSEELRNDPHQFIELVRKWLNHRRNWLLVLDGIHFTGAIERYIPDSKSTSLIYTSTERSVVGDHRFMNPQLIKLPPLSAREGQRLLLLELDKKEPFIESDLRYSMELVQSMGFLPVVIHSVAQRLKTTNEPLSRFAKHYSSEPRLRGLGTFMAVVDQLKELGAVEALNLIYLLCFFSQHIPVEMIALGLRAVGDIQVKAKEPVIGRHLNNTFKILNTFALMDRNEPELSVQSSQSSKASRDMLTENIDVIRLHGVVQGFFIDTLAADHSLPIWLDRAVRVFCCSYDLANAKIMRKPDAGRVEDYRLYEIHAVKLREHLAKFVGKHISPTHKEILLEAQEMLWIRLEAIKVEIERRTPESSQVIAGKRSDTFQTSVFDRTSSSSDTGPDTPGINDKVHYGVSTWGLGLGKAQHESPSSLTNDTEYVKGMQNPYRNQFPLAMPEDPGYESDREGSATMIPRPSQPNRLDGLADREGGISRGTRGRIEPSSLHRTVKNLERSRYRDSAGAYRSMSAVDPRLSTELAKGFLQGNGPRSQSRGRISGQSSAEVALTHITTSSPPPARGGGMIQDRRSSSQRPTSRGRMMTGIPSYAAPVASPTIDTYPELEIDLQPIIEPIPPSYINTQVSARPISSAVLSLQRFPVDVSRRPSVHILPQQSQPPYPQTPYLHPGSDSADYQMPSDYGQENATSDPDLFSSNLYPAMEGLPPVEMSCPPALLAHHQDRDVSTIFSGSLPSSMILPRPMRDQDPLSNSSPDIRISRQESDIPVYYPGRPELSNQGGYSSQPMSRGPSGESEHSAKSTGLLERRRRPSAAETEPMPQLPVFSPRIAPTSYQVYERMRERDMLLGYGDRELDLQAIRRERARRAVEKRSPRLEFARAALIEKLEDWENIPPTSSKGRPFNPTAPSFSPSQANFTNSPALPQAPANSMLSSSFPSASTSVAPTTYPSPFMNQGNDMSASYPSPHQPANTPSSFTNITRDVRTRSDGSREHMPRSDEVLYRVAGDGVASGSGSGSAERMERSESGGSGGVVVGNRLIEFGDYPEPVDYVLARERVLRSWGEREREAEMRRRRRRSRDGSGGNEIEEAEEYSVGGDGLMGVEEAKAVGLGLEVEMGD